MKRMNDYKTIGRRYEQHFFLDERVSSQLYDMHCTGDAKLAKLKRITFTGCNAHNV